MGFFRSPFFTAPFFAVVDEVAPSPSLIFNVVRETRDFAVVRELRRFPVLREQRLFTVTRDAP